VCRFFVVVGCVFSFGCLFSCMFLFGGVVSGVSGMCVLFFFFQAKGGNPNWEPARWLGEFLKRQQCP
ncbi:hypothetical protein, partial [Bradyrhizobium canariense]|uniref:hypothetical protein n=1 Tax=Bradyrhizobium canariense TaxID=255045 RepID=UPI001AEC8211